MTAFNFRDAAAWITAIILVLHASGRGDLVTKSLIQLRKVALTEAHKPWGWPIFDRHACYRIKQ